MLRIEEMSRRGKTCRAVILVACMLSLSTAAQDGASFNSKARDYRAPAGSLAGSADTTARVKALGLIYQGDVDKGIAALKELVEHGDVPSALLLAAFYRKQSRLPVPVDPPQALQLYEMASHEGSGEASERIAEMVESREVPDPLDGGAEYWRGLAAKQGWREQRLATYCFDWTHGPESLHCDADPSPTPGKAMLDAIAPCPGEDEMRQMREHGVTGAIHLDGGGIRLDSGPRATAILLFDHAVPSEEDLLEPDAGTVIYVQTPSDHWRMLPPGAPLLNRFLILTPRAAGAGRMSMSAQAVDGSQTGGACSSFTN